MLSRSSAVTSSRWRHQTTVVHSLYPDHTTTELSRTSLHTGLHSAPPRVPPYPCIPTTSSLTFHPNEMIMAIGTPDGLVRLLGCKLVDRPDIYRFRTDTHSILSNGVHSLQLASP